MCSSRIESLRREQALITPEHSERAAEVPFSTRLQAPPVFTSAAAGEVDFTPALHPWF